jgi:hypothetical protein
MVVVVDDNDPLLQVSLSLSLCTLIVIVIMCRPEQSLKGVV